jgi:hypothetical protein
MTATYRRSVRLPLTMAVERVISALRDRGFDVSSPVGRRDEKKASDGSKTRGFSIIGVSGQDWAVKSPDGDEISVWLNVMIAAVDGRTVDIAVAPLPIRDADIASDPRFQLFREGLDTA